MAHSFVDLDLADAASRCARPSGVDARALAAADIFARTPGGITLPLKISDSLPRCSADLGTPLRALEIFSRCSEGKGLPAPTPTCDALILARVSAETTLPRRSFDISARRSDDSLRPFLAADIFALDSAECLRPVAAFDSFARVAGCAELGERPPGLSLYPFSIVSSAAIRAISTSAADSGEGYLNSSTTSKSSLPYRWIAIANLGHISRREYAACSCHRFLTLRQVMPTYILSVDRQVTTYRLHPINSGYHSLPTVSSYWEASDAS
jgi:hypothetical protein